MEETVSISSALIRRGTVSILVILLIAGIPLGAGASAARAADMALAAANSAPVFVVGQEGGRTAPMIVTIDGTGAVAVTSGKPAHSWRPRGHLSQDALDGLMKLAQAEGFFRLPSTIIAAGPTNSPARYISIRSRTRVTRVTVRLARNRAFDQLYAVLLAAADVVGDAPPGHLESL
jgi:hypothetical protein